MAESRLHRGSGARPSRAKGAGARAAGTAQAGRAQASCSSSTISQPSPLVNAPRPMLCSALGCKGYLSGSRNVVTMPSVPRSRAQVPHEPMVPGRKQPPISPRLLSLFQPSLPPADTCLAAPEACPCFFTLQISNLEGPTSCASRMSLSSPRSFSSDDSMQWGDRMRGHHAARENSAARRRVEGCGHGPDVQVLAQSDAFIRQPTPSYLTYGIRSA